MANYTMRADGTAANLAAALNGDPAVPSECLSVDGYHSYVSGASPGDQFLCADGGGVYDDDNGTHVLSAGLNGTAVGGDHIIKNYPGHTPVFDGADDGLGSAYQWTLSSSGTNEWYLEASGGGNPNIAEPHHMKYDSTYIRVDGSLGSLADHEAGFGDNDSLGFSTVYWRDDTGDPDTSGVTIAIPQRIPIRVQNRSYVTIDGLTARHSAPQWYGGFHVDQSSSGSNCTVKNCIAERNASGIEMQRGDNNTVDGNTVRYNYGLGINHKGQNTNQITGSEIKNNLVHDTIQTQFVGGLEDGYGIKAYWWNGGSIHNNEVRDCAFQGMDLDGDNEPPAGWVGCDDVDVYENYIHGNDGAGLMIELSSDGNRVYRNWIENNGGEQIRIWWFAQDNEIYNNILIGPQGSTTLLEIQTNTVDEPSSGTLIYGNVFYKGAIHVWADAGKDCLVNAQIFNNIFIEPSTWTYYFPSPNYTGFDSDYNIFNEYEGNWSSWTGLGYDGNSLNTTTSPVKDAPNSDFEIPPGSAAIGFGFDLGSPYNIGIAPGSTWPDNVSTLDQDDY